MGSRLFVPVKSKAAVQYTSYLSSGSLERLEKTQKDTENMQTWDGDSANYDATVLRASSCLKKKYF